MRFLHSLLGASPSPWSVRLRRAIASGHAPKLAQLFPTLMMICLLGSTTALVGAATINTTPELNLSSRVGPPTTQLVVSGVRFDPNAGIDIYFDMTDLALATTNSGGSFSNIVILVPASASPGTHWVTGVSRASGKSATKSFLVRTDWAQYQFDANRTGYNPYENVLGPTTVSHIGMHWSYFAGGFGSSTPAVVNGVVYVGNDDGNLYAMNANTGALVWQYTTGGSVSDSPAVNKGVVYFGSSDGNLYAVNATTGALVWKYAAGSGIESSPAVYYLSWASPVVYFRSGDGNLFAVNATTGALLWRFLTGGGGGTTCGPAVANGVVYVGSAYGVLYALDAKTGVLLWTYDTGYLSLWSPVVTKDVVYFLSRAGLFALNAKSGALLWTLSVFLGPDNWIFPSAPPTVSNGVLYFPTFDVDGDFEYMVAVNAKTRALFWAQKTGSAYIGISTITPVVANGVIYGGNNADGTLYALDASTGNRLWTYFEPSYRGGAGPVVANGVVYAGYSYNYDLQIGTFHAFDLIGSSYPTGANPSSRPDPSQLHPNFSLQPSVPLQAVPPSEPTPD
ncbi:MAG TPA: PQQ-binding-like beta-propeller repeat protein [Terriglobales bacterium]